MVSFIIVAKEKTKRQTYVKEYASKLAIDRYDITIIERDTESKTASQSIGIETVKIIQKKLFLKPIKSVNKLIIFEDAQTLTPEAQNALLKVLEEPPEHTHIILGTDSQEALLPTIISRCQVIALVEEQKKISDETLVELKGFVETLPGLSIGEKLKLAEKLAKDKDKAIEWIENLIFIVHEDMLHTVSRKDAAILRQIQTLHTLLKTTNVNTRLAIEQTLLSI